MGIEPRRILADLAPASKVLVIRLRSLGDMLLITPALRALKAWRPDLELWVAVERHFAPVLEGNPDVSGTVVLQGQPRPGTGSFARALGEIRRQEFHACYNLHGGTRSMLLTLLSGARFRVGFAHYRHPFAYNVRVPNAEQFFGRREFHTVEHRISAFYWTGLPEGEIPPMQFFPREEARRTVRGQLAAAGRDLARPYALIQPTAALFTKQWSAAGFAEVARHLEQRHGLQAILTCGLGEDNLLDEMDRAAGRRSVRLENPSFGELGALIEGAELFVANDSGPTHMAAALGCPSVVIFSSTSSTLWRPWRCPHQIVQNYFPCNPCPADRCYAFDEPKCILSITAEQVKAAVDRMLAEAPAKAGWPEVSA